MSCASSEVEEGVIRAELIITDDPGSSNDIKGDPMNEEEGFDINCDRFID